MRHNIEIEHCTRDADGEVFVLATMRDLAGADRFSLISSGETIKDAMKEMGVRLQLIAADASDIADKILDQYPQEDAVEDANSSSPEEKKDGVHLRLLECDSGSGGAEDDPGDDGGCG